MSRIGRYLWYEVAVLARIARIGRHLLCEVAVLARIAGRYEPYWPLFCCTKRLFWKYRWPSWAVLATICCVKWWFWPVPVAVMSRSGRYLLYEVAALARIAGRCEPYWPLYVVWCGCSDPYRWPL